MNITAFLSCVLEETKYMDMEQPEGFVKNISVNYRRVCMDLSSPQDVGMGH